MRLAEAQDERRARSAALFDELLTSDIDALCDVLHLDGPGSASRVSPHARMKLKAIIDHYKVMPKPWTQCVADNTKRFGPEMAKHVCGVVKALGKSSATTVETHLSDDSLRELLDDQSVELLHVMSGVDYEVLLAMDAKQRKALQPSDFVFTKQRRYPIHDRAHGANALARASGKPEYAAVKSAVCERYKDLPACSESKGGSGS